MFLSVKRHLVLINFILLFKAFGLAQSISIPQDTTVTYSVLIEFRNINISGICIIHDERQAVIGSCVNEFGIKMFDFKYDKRKDKFKLFNIVKMMDKWYIKRIVSSDLSVLFRKENTEKHLRKRTINASKDSVVLANHKYKLRYKLVPIYETEE